MTKAVKKLGPLFRAAHQKKYQAHVESVLKGVDREIDGFLKKLSTAFSNAVNSDFSFSNVLELSKPSEITVILRSGDFKEVKGHLATVPSFKKLQAFCRQQDVELKVAFNGTHGCHFYEVELRAEPTSTFKTTFTDSRRR
jgi:hypothetical protein